MVNVSSDLSKEIQANADIPSAPHPSFDKTAQPQELTDGEVFARLYGEPLLTLPKDLYIPPEALEIFLDAFEGPLDLLLYLIRRQNFNIMDIPMLSVTKQYLAYVDQIKEKNLELASEYLLMAAMLIEIKSRMLLPIKKMDDSEEIDPRAELVKRLIEYEKIKFGAVFLGDTPVLERDFYRSDVMMVQSHEIQFPDVNVSELQTAWQDIWRRATLNQNHIIERESLSVREFMSQILKQLQGIQFIEFEDLFHGKHSKSAVVVTFVAILELVKESLIEVIQAEAFAPIYLRLAYRVL